ncbi:M1 family metallopeptidase [Cochleicola gelatinilyticus]|uniref:Aminopeptidase N n=1 Tax=Cochleicola gelatinilyticus TaxID=1763537 RepID=A0A167HG84_9FLAO|nr:M1 family metallopeptidase [Cochleicola gelatinilyticus]OAB78575.1 aminopeptidase [Cochleicola gelatinilyticus]
MIKYIFLLFICSTVGFAQQTDVVDFITIEAIVQPIPSEEKIKGTMQVSFKMLQSTDSIYLDAHAMKLTYHDDVAGIREISSSASEDKIWLKANFKAGKVYKTFISFEAIPKQTLYFTNDQVWTQGQGKYTSHWLPSIDDMNDKIEFDLTIVAAPEKTVIANGKLRSKRTETEFSYWKYDMQKPMSSYLVAFAIGNFVKKDIKSDSGIPIELYLSKIDSALFEPTYRYTKTIFDFFEKEIDVPYPWQNYKQVPVRDFLYAGMENTTATIFSQAFVVDSTAFKDRNYVTVNAHELAHQWFGDLVTETEGTHHWLQEGFATYYALLAEKEIFGDDYYYWKLFQSAEQLQALSDDGKGEALLNAKASSLTFYEKGAWALHLLRELIGEESFKSAIKNYLQKYAYKNVETSNFIDEVKAVSNVDLAQWEADWLHQSAFKAEQAYQSLKQSEFINNYFEVAALRGVPLQDKKSLLTTALTFPNDFIGQEAIYQLVGEPLTETLPLYKKAFESNNLFVRQAIVISTEEIPGQLKTNFESLLKDDSYVTKEAALYGLWLQFPKDRTAYLNELKDVIGFQNKNIRQLWLALALVTEGYETAFKESFLNELKGYSSSDFSFEIRETAFGYIHELQLYDKEILKNLVSASVHHNWRFRNYARGLLSEVFKNEAYKATLSGLMKELSEKEKRYLNSKFLE